jgi:intein-encoded DNA endonuclease-like protein
MEEYLFTMDYNLGLTQEKKIRKLNGTNLEDLQFIYSIADGRISVSQSFGTAHTQELLMFYGLYVFSQDIYFLEDKHK